MFSEKGTGNRQFSISHLWFFICIFILIIGSVGIGILIPDYIHLKTTYIKDNALSYQVESQNEELTLLRQQIQKFANQINELKNRLVFLNNFEKKVRTVANIEMPSNDELYGIGGAVPEDLDVDFSLKEQQNALMRDMHKQVDQLTVSMEVQENNFSLLIEALEDRRELLSCTPSIRPTKGWISSSFGYRISPFTGKRELHKGIDIANHEGTKIIATANGIVTFYGRNGGYGNMMIIDHGYGMVSNYAHLKKNVKDVGDIVKRGDLIGYMGNSGRSTGPHLHYEVRLNGVPVDPDKYFLN